MRGVQSRRGAAVWHAGWVAVLAPLVLSCGDDPVGPNASEFADEPAPDVRPDVVAFVDVSLVPMNADLFVPGQTVLILIWGSLTFGLS